MSIETPVALTIPGFCRTYAIGRTRAYEMIGAGTITAKKFGATTLIDRASAEAWYRNLPGFTPAQRITKMPATIAAKVA
jgi:hypothetical protein